MHETSFVLIYASACFTRGKEAFVWKRRACLASCRSLQHAIQSDFRSATFIARHESSRISNRKWLNCRPERIRIFLSRDRCSHDFSFDGSSFCIVNNNGGAVFIAICCIAICCIVISAVGLLMQYHAFHDITDLRAKANDTQHPYILFLNGMSVTIGFGLLLTPMLLSLIFFLTASVTSGVASGALA